MSGAGTFALVVAALAAGVGVGWWMRGSKAAAEAAAAVETAVAAKTKDVEDLTSRLAAADERAKTATTEFEAKLRAVRKETAGVQKELADKTAELEAARASAPAAPVAATPTPAPAAASRGPRFAFGQFAKLAEVDWKVVGENLNAMTPLVAEISEKLKKGEVPGEAYGKLQQHNGPLVAAAVKVTGEIPGTGTNGAFTHPAFQVNAMAAALDAARLPLSDAQATALEKVGREYSDEDARRLEKYAESTYAMQKTIDEADVRRRFYDAAFAVLTKEQSDALTPPSIKGQLGFDLYSDGLLWMTVMRPLPFKEKDTDALVTSVSGVLNTGLKIPRDQQDAARAVIGRWAQELPASITSASDESDEDRDRRVEPVREAARQTLALLQRLVLELRLEGPQADAAKRWPAVLRPAPSKTE